MTAIDKQDYAEPRCLLCEEPYGAEAKIKPVPQQRIMEKVDEYMSRRDYAGVERHLLYWLEEARLGRDEKGELMIRNELIGHYRKTGEKDKSFAQADAALDLLDRMDFDGSISAGTTYVNAATAFQAFGENARAIETFEKARAVYEAIPSLKPALLGGLYNNMALSLVSLKRFDEANGMYQKAIETMANAEHGALEQAITYLNMANAAEDEKGLLDACETIDAYLETAQRLLDAPGIPHEGYYAFVCEKCAPTFEYYGWFQAANELNERARAWYERT
ncbi:MAG: tetratricopeptide repeat protein [Clostridia bacterium]|nr:tetratricopeptide repeat protein [Clostridia bacterium]